MKARVLIRLKDEVPDVQGETIVEQLGVRGFHEVVEARVGKLVEFTFEGGDVENAKTRIKQMCQQMLVNAVIEEFEVLSIE